MWLLLAVLAAILAAFGVIMTTVYAPLSILLFIAAIWCLGKMLK